MEENERSTRHRINVTISVKGVVTWDCTYEANDSTLEDVLAESDKMVAALKERYPVKVDEK